MTYILEECSRFKATNQRLADQARTMIKKAWISDLEALEIHQQINWESRQQEIITIIDIRNNIKQEPSIRNEMQSNSNRNTRHPKHREQRQRRKKEYWHYKGNYVWKEYFIIIAKIPRIENSQRRIWKQKKQQQQKKKRIIKIYLNEQHHRIKPSNLSKSKIYLW